MLKCPFKILCKGQKTNKEHFTASKFRNVSEDSKVAEGFRMQNNFRGFKRGEGVQRDIGLESLVGLFVKGKKAQKEHLLKCVL